MQDIDAFLKELKRVVVVRSHAELGRPYETAIMPAIKKLKAEIQKQYIAEEMLAKKREQAIINTAPPEVLQDLDEFLGDCSDNHIFLQQQMAVIAEMRLVYLYKSYEIELKKILLDAYPAEVAALEALEEQINFLRLKRINLKKIPGYRATNELRIIVNNIKHATKLNARAKAIPEFQTSEAVVYQNGTDFYKRIEPLVNQYIEGISEKVFNSLS
ncbi:hypothetical protein [Arcticibacter tournemirensis]|uniref:Uncharacterized protein n=1 Tax=Arcticibacter tournemirensis TaxID=699437 RepID=A0A4Q0M4T8_9SPHI|nr:hypothetical protein [Arcticibacter tournemirensis]RXF67739.1 hypothetical protein EKH83_18090 [Arcticibacter tournemirensis]